MVDSADAGQLPEKLAIRVKTRRSVAKPAENLFPPVGPWPEGMLFRIKLQLLLPVLGQVLIAQVPVLPQLQRRQQHH